jgi:hypothetical protein
MPLERENEIEGDDVENGFAWHVGWSGQPTGEVHVDDREIVRKFNAFKPDLKRIGSYREVAAWHKDDVG